MGKITLKCSNPECEVRLENWMENEQAPLCPACGSQMVAEKQIVIENEKHWLIAAAENDDLWKAGVEENYPSVIAYEYRQLRKYCREKKPYAVLLSLKDNFESLLKLETLLAFAWAKKRMGKEFEQSTISQLTIPNLSLGAWVNLALILVESIDKHNKSLSEEKKILLPEILPLETLRKMYAKQDIVGWRNKQIAHGAMQLEEDEIFREDLLKKIIVLKNIYEAVGSRLEQQKLFCGNMPLVGADRARDLAPDLDGIIEFRSDNVSFSVDPFIVIRKHETRGKGVYFFDNQKAPTRTLMQAHSEGSLLNEEVGYFSRLRSMLEQWGLHLDAHPDDPYLSEEETRELDILQMSHKFVEPEHLSGWLKECVKNHKKGIFLLLMGRGIGKSVFSEKLNRLYNDPLEIDPDLDVRTYHFSRLQTALSDDFERRTEWMWSCSFENKTDWSHAPRIRDLIITAEKQSKGTGQAQNESEINAAQAVSGFLEEVRKYSAIHRGKGKILMVLDGLDEIMNESSWEYIPAEGQLAEGVYILLTSRDPEEEDLPENVGEHLKKLKVQETLRIGKESEGNDIFLRKYINKAKLGKLSKQHVRELIDRTDHRVLQLGLYCRLLENGMSWESLPDAEHVVEKYFERMEECLGESGAIFVREVLAVLCTLGSLEALNIKDLGNMTVEGDVTLRLVGVLRDLSPFLRIERTEEGNKYTIVNSDIAEELAKQLPGTEDTVRSMVKTAMSYLKKGYPLEEAWIEPASAHVTELAQKWLPEKAEALDANAEKNLKQITVDWEKHINTVHDRERICNLRLQLFLLSLEKHGEKHPSTLSSLKYLAWSFSDLGQYDKSLNLSQQLYELSKRVLGPENRNTLQAINTLADEFRMAGRYQEALELSRKGYERSKRILGPEDAATLHLQNCWANALISMGKYEDAMPQLLQLYKSYERTYGTEHPYTLTILSSMAVGMSGLGKYEEALPLYRKVFKMRKRVLSSNDPVLLASINNLAGGLCSAGKYEEALQLYREIYEKSKRALGKTHPDTLGTLYNLAVTQAMTGSYEEALHLLQEAYKAQKRMVGAEHPQTLRSLDALSRTLAKEGRLQEALTLCREAYEIRKRVLGADHPDTLETSKLLTSLNQHSDMRPKEGTEEETLSLYQKEYESKKQTLGAEDPATLESLHELAFVLFNLKRYGEALPLIQEAYEVRKRVLGPDNKETLRSLHNLAGTLAKMGKYEEALPLSLNAYKIRERVLGAKDRKTIESKNNYQEIIRAIKTAKAAKAANAVKTAKDAKAAKRLSKIKTKEKLAFDLWKKGSCEEAVGLFQEVYEEYKQVSGPDHKDTVTAFSNFAAMLSKVGRYEESLLLGEEAYEACKRVLGQEHPRTLSTLGNIGVTLKYLGRNEEALQKYREAYEAQKRVLGEEHESTLRTLDNMADVLYIMKKYEELLPLDKKRYEINKRLSGTENPDTLTAMKDLAETLSNLGKNEESLQLFQELYETRKHMLGEEHEDTLDALYNRAVTLDKLGRHEESLTDASVVFEACFRNFGVNHPITRKTIEFINKGKGKFRLLKFLRLLKIK